MTQKDFTPAEWNEGIASLVDVLGSVWVDKPVVTVSEYAEENRVLPIGTPFPGPWTNSKTPYLVEPMNNMAVYSGIQRTIIAKGAQLGFTAAAENVVAYFMDVAPAQILFISATQPLLVKWVTKRLEPLIDSCGIRNKIFAQVENKKSRRTGDKVFIKEFIGGTLEMASAQSPADLRADSKQVLIRDEIDGAPRMLITGEGDWLKVSYVRTNAFGIRRKVLDFSTPTTYDDSAIWQEYESGDQRRLFVPCPHCGTFQKLEWSTDDKALGMQWEIKDGRVARVWYACEACHKEIYNYHKGDMLAPGEWRPTSRSYADYVRSYQLSSIYSPVGMLSWEEMVIEYLDAQSKPDGMRSFDNLYLGKPHRARGSRPKLENVIELRGGYRNGTVPEGVLFITIGVDVQRGSEKKDTDNPARLEMEVCGHGIGFRSFSIDYQVFYGEVDDPSAGAWVDLENHWRENKMQYSRADGKKFTVKMALVDSGDGQLTDVVYRFCSKYQGVYPSKGFSALRKQKKEKGDELTATNFRRYRAAQIGSDITLYEVSTNYYKNHVYNNLKIQRQEVAPQKPGFCDFPIDYGEKYFKMLTAEEKRTDGSFHCPSQRRNEALDVRVLNLCACDVYLDQQVINLRTAAKERGATPGQIQGCNHKMVLQMLTKAVEKK